MVSVDIPARSERTGMHEVRHSTPCLTKSLPPAFVLCCRMPSSRIGPGVRVHCVLSSSASAYLPCGPTCSEGCGQCEGCRGARHPAPASASQAPPDRAHRPRRACLAGPYAACSQGCWPVRRVRGVLVAQFCFFSLSQAPFDRAPWPWRAYPAGST